MKRLVVVVVNYCTPELTIKALASLAGQLDPECDAAVVVDNASADSSAEQLDDWIERRGHASWIRLLRSETNGGFSAGCNLGIRSVPATYYLLLNSDAELQDKALARILETADENPRAGLVGAALDNPEGEAQCSCFRFHSPLSQLIEGAVSGPITRLLSRWDVPLPPSTTLREANWTSFACVLLRRQMLEEVGLLDEGYFLYYEDVDLCRRAGQGGWQVLCDGRARIAHHEGGSSPVPLARLTRTRPPRYLYHSRARYFTRFYGRSGFFAANALWSAGRLVSLTRELFGRRPRQSCPGEWRDIWRSGGRESRPTNTPVPVL